MIEYQSICSILGWFAESVLLLLWVPSGLLELEGCNVRIVPVFLDCRSLRGCGAARTMTCEYEGGGVCECVPVGFGLSASEYVGGGSRCLDAELSGAES